jgi:hypothetical protein
MAVHQCVLFNIILALIGTVYYNLTNIILRNVLVQLPRLEIIPSFGLLLDIRTITGIHNLK